MKKRIVALLIVLCLVCGMVPAVSAEDVTSGTWDNITWSFSNGVLTISGEGDMAYEIDGDHLYNQLYPYSDETTKIVVEEGITSLCRGIFCEFRYTTEVSLPSTLTKIDSEAFAICYSLDEITIPASVKELGNSVFVYNWDLAVRFTGDAPKMKVYAVVDEEGDWGTLSDFHGTIFYPGNNPTWTEAYMSTNYGQTDVVWQPYFTSGTCGENLTWYIEGDTLYIEGEGDMYDYGSFVNGELSPHGDAPWKGLSFTNLEIGPGVTSIGNDAFWSCNSLRTSNLGESNVLRIGAGAFGYTSLESVTVPEGVTVLENSVFYGTSNLETVTLPESLVTIESAAFYNSGLKELTIPSNVSYMGNNVFDYVKNAVIRFTGDAPELAKAHEEYEEIGHTFELFQGTIYYPGNNPTWTEDIVGESNSWRTWIPYIVNPFEDVTSSDYYYEPVLWALEKSITDGTSDTEFSPDDFCTRGQVVTFLWRAAGEPKAASKVNPFVDVKSTDYYYDAVLWAVEKGITDGMDDTHFEPKGDCSRSQVVTFLYRAFGEPPVGNAGDPFVDVPAADWFTAPVLWAVKEGITDGVTETEFRPKDVCKRGQVVTFLYRAYN